jgi:hypothetical protein
VNVQFDPEAGLRLPETDDVHRDLRLDACRGMALWFVFVDHVPNNILSWLTLRNYGFSDATEVFVFISGYTCMISYGGALRSQGWFAMSLRAVRRSWQIYVAFLLLLIVYLAFVQSLEHASYRDETNAAVFFAHPGPAILHACLMQYRLVNTDILPLFVLLHFFFPALLWLFTRSTSIALASSLLLYVSVQVLGTNLQAWPHGEWYFNPLAWQMLFVLGMWCAMDRSAPIRRMAWSPIALTASVSYLLLSLIVVLSWQVEGLDNVILPHTLSHLIYPIDKSNLSPARLLHFVALACVAIRLMPRSWHGSSSLSAIALIRCGEHSLTIFCLSILLSFIGHVVIQNTSITAPMQALISMTGIAIMVAVATLLTWAAKLEGRKPRLF